MFAEDIGVKGTPGFIPRATVREDGKQALLALDEKLKGAKTLFGRERSLSLFEAADGFRKQIDNLSKTIREDKFLSESMSKEITSAIDENKGFYATRMYRTLKDNSEYKPTIAQESAALDEIKNIYNAQNPGEVMSDKAAQEVLVQLRNKVSFNNAKMTPKDQFSEDTLKAINRKILKGRQLDSLPAVRDFLGEYSGDRDWETDL